MEISPSLSATGRSMRLLIVADGSIHFGPQGPFQGFTLTELLKILSSGDNNLWSSLDITTALRGDDPLTCNCTKNTNFRFDGPLFTKGDFDQVWLFGALEEDKPLIDDSEVHAMFDFMKKGGGVFATGDHESLGAAMCAKLPRVGSMRKWFYNKAPCPNLKAPGKEDETRLDTLREGVDLRFQIDDQSDSVPQEIRPKFFLKKGGKGSDPHPVLVDDSNFAITVLPDHMHEGECLVPGNLEKKFVFDGESYDEYPTLANTNPPTRLSPQVVAISTSATGYMQVVGTPIPPVEPRSFVSLVSYEGDLVGVGRVVVDSSFHHYLDINLRGIGAANPQRTGFFDANGNPTRDYITFTKFYKNLVSWLSPAPVRTEMYAALLVNLRFNAFLAEELSPIQKPALRDFLVVGSLTRSVISERYSDAVATQCLLALIGGLPDRLKRSLEVLINHWLPRPLAPNPLELILNPDLLFNALLGSIMLRITNELPFDPNDAILKLQESGRTASAALLPIVNRGLEAVLPTLSSVFRESSERMSELSELFSQ